MSGALAVVDKNLDAIEQALVTGNIGALNQADRLGYYDKLCKSLGLNPLTQPFEYLTLNGKVRLYAKKDCTDQLRSINGVSVTKLEKERIEDVYAVTAYVQDAKGRVDSAVGAVTVGNLKGDALANALMKAETKAKRRATLSICGLGFLDETEIETIPSRPISQAVMEAEAKLICADCDGEVDAYTYTDKHGEKQFVPLEKIRETAAQDFPGVNLCGGCQIKRHAAKRKPMTLEQEASASIVAVTDKKQRVDVLAIEEGVDKALSILIDDKEGRAEGIINQVLPKKDGKPFMLRLESKTNPALKYNFGSFHTTHQEQTIGREGQHIVLWYDVTQKNKLTYRNIKEIESIDGKPVEKSEEPF